MAERPKPLNGLRHLALAVYPFEECIRFYTEILGMEVLRKASDNLIYLSCGNDNLSLSRAYEPQENHNQSLDHFGFIVDSKEELQAWFVFLKAKGVPLLDTPHDHSDGARSFHCTDPAGNVVQPIYHPAISGQRLR
ncbi:VOC family protein [Photobacterium sp. WH77]|uniref:VOC family protein n=1 Tax=Photobacterium arenosum TaxID=2774143 RepID=A0ABR9BFU0_9GAMM|nr:MULTISPECIES: VOC family protein [Photobacterium]MBD8511419.1 VOC family protein [Photobacterium arenosum]MBV7263076.1 VOC family protein [Photobacterium sp. WH24]MCG2837645.1 VOC family protein [Photobacterium sp. WH77]MCG2845261.1 VOC family protein [Photobacterium sp. WH80]MDO6583060.1 VOC family protein [Photobacterium sp. 2_MG-2023]